MILDTNYKYHEWKSKCKVFSLERWWPCNNKIWVFLTPLRIKKRRKKKKSHINLCSLFVYWLLRLWFWCWFSTLGILNRQKCKNSQVEGTRNKKHACTNVDHLNENPGTLLDLYKPSTGNSVHINQAPFIWMTDNLSQFKLQLFRSFPNFKTNY